MAKTRGKKKGERDCLSPPVEGAGTVPLPEAPVPQVDSAAPDRWAGASGLTLHTPSRRWTDTPHSMPATPSQRLDRRSGSPVFLCGAEDFAPEAGFAFTFPPLPAVHRTV